MSEDTVSAHNIVISTEEKSPLAIPQSNAKLYRSLLAQMLPPSA